MGRPRKYDDEKLEEIKTIFAEYIENTEIPIVAEFAYQNQVPVMHCMIMMSFPH